MIRYVNLQQPNCTGISLNGLPSVAYIGSTLTLIIIVYPNMAGYVVALKDGNTQIDQKTTDSNGIAIFDLNTTGATIGNHSISVIANPGSCIVTQPIDLFYAPCNVSISTNPTSQEHGKTITLIAVTDASPTTAYKVIFRDEGVQITDMPLPSNGIASYDWDTSSTTIGHHDITADVYNIYTGTIQCTTLTPSTTTIYPITGTQRSGNSSALLLIGLLVGVILISREKEKSPEKVSKISKKIPKK